MKTKILLANIVLLLLSVTLYSQQTDIIVNNLKMDSTYTHEVIVNNLGTPDRIVDIPNEDNLTYKMYYYGNSIFEFLSDRFIHFYIMDIGTTFIANNILRVGGNFSSINLLGGEIIKNSQDLSKNEGLIIWRPYHDYYGGFGSLTVEYNLQTGKITALSGTLIDY